MKRNWGGDYQNVSILVAISVGRDGFREIIGAAEGSKEDNNSWLEFLRTLKSRGLIGTQLFVGDKCLGLFETISEVFPEARFQRCIVHFYRNVFSVVPTGKVKEVVAMLKDSYPGRLGKCPGKGVGCYCKTKNHEIIPGGGQG